MARRRAHKLTVREVASIKKPGWHGDGAGLWLRVFEDGGKFWVFVFIVKGKRHEKGLGPAAGPNAVTLQAARQSAEVARSLVKAGANPLEQARHAKKRQGGTCGDVPTDAGVPTFGEIAEEYIKQREPTWKNDKHVAQWKMTLREYAKPLATTPVNLITTADVFETLKPHWQERPETASRLRSRIELVLSAAGARGFRTGPNPAAWRDNLQALLPARRRLTRGHHAALPYDEIADFMKELRSRGGFAAKALQFCILTAARTGEVLQAQWTQIDLHKKVWTVPAGAMKSGREHRVPLSDPAVAILKEMSAARLNDFVFPGHGPKPISSAAMSAVLKRLGRTDITVHGFRSSFRDFAAEETSAVHEVAEMALAHVIPNKAEAAYRRGDLFEKRRTLMTDWANWCEFGSQKIVPLRVAGGE